MTSRRLYVPVVLTLLACGGLAFFAASRTWVEATVGPRGFRRTRSSSRALTPSRSSPRLALVVVTGALAVLAASVRVRWVVGVLMVVVGVGAAMLGRHRRIVARRRVRRRRAELHRVHRGERAGRASVIVWPVLAGAVFVLAELLGLVVVRLAATWPTMGSRYESPTGQGDDARSEDDLWAALDEGRDPTE